MLEQLRGVLKGLKWSDYDTLAYATLVEKGAMTPQELVYETDIPSGRIYDVVKSLEKRGALIEDGGKPKRYDAQNPRSILFGELHKLEKEVEKALPTAEQAWDKRANTLDANEGTVAWTMRGQKAIVAQIRTLINDSPSSFLLCDNDLSWLGRRDYKILRQMVAAKKDVRIVGHASFTEELEYLDSIGIAVRIYEGARLRDCCIINNTFVLLKVGNPPSCLAFHDKNYLQNALREFEKDFKSSKKMEVKKLAP